MYFIEEKLQVKKRENERKNEKDFDEKCKSIELNKKELFKNS